MFQNSIELVCLCSLTLLVYHAVSTHAGHPMLLWSSKRSSLRTSGIYSTFALPEQQRYSRGFVTSTRMLSLKLPHIIASFDSYDAKRKIAVMDVGRGNLAVVNSHSREILQTHRGINNKAKNLAIDWMSGNIYWTDERRKWICVLTEDFKHLKPVITNVAFPRGIALYPQKGLMFWSQMSDTYEPAKIMKASMSGESPTVLFRSFGRPIAIALDYHTDTIFWIDSREMTIFYSSINEELNEPEVLYKNANLSLKDLHIFKTWLYVTAETQNMILILNKTSGDILHVIKTYTPAAVTIVGGDSQPVQPGPCDINNGGCEHFCFSQPPGNMRKCGCNMGMVLDDDGTTCVSNIMYNDFFLVVDSDSRWIAQVSSDGKKYCKLDLPKIKIPVQAEYDDKTTRVYWTDVGTHSVNRANLDGSNYIVLAKENVRQPTGIALDHYSKNLYWADEGTGTINVVRTDGTHRKTLISKDVELPRGLALNPNSGLMWWTDWGKQTIECAAMDGSERRIIINKTLNWVNGLAADFSENKIYWCDAKRDVIETSSLDGTNREILVKQKHPAHVFGLTLTKDFIYWSDWNRPTLLRMGKHDVHKRIEIFGPSIFDRTSDIHAFVEKSISTIENDNNPCEKANGNCTGLCIPIPNSGISSNDVVNTVETDKFKTTRVCLCGNKYNGTCDKPTNGTDGTPPSFGKTCPPSMTLFASQCNTKVLLNYSIPTATDNSGKVTVEIPANPPPLTLSEGDYEHRYTAVDTAGNHDTCKFTISVNVVRCLPLKQYLTDNSIKVINSSCENLFGSLVHLKCLDGTRRGDHDLYMKCEQDGKWSGDYFCPIQASTTPAKFTLESTTTRNLVIIQESITNEAIPEQNQETKYSEKSFNTTLMNVVATSTVKFPFIAVISMMLAVMIIIGAAGCYKYYRTNSIPILAVMEKTVTYKSDSIADTSVLGITEEITTHIPTVNQNPPPKCSKANALNIDSHRRLDLLDGKDNPACNIELTDERKLSKNGSLA